MSEGTFALYFICTVVIISSLAVLASIRFKKIMELNERNAESVKEAMADRKKILVVLEEIKIQLQDRKA